MKLYFIAGEQSGDYIGSCIIRSIKQNANLNQLNLEILGIGGNEMQAEGVKSLFNISEISLMGFVEILPKIFKIRRLINDSIDDIAIHKPDILITIDSPGFTFRVAKAIRKLLPEIKLIHVVAPSVWVYKQGRAKKYAKIYDHLLTLLPFEPQYFEKYGLACTHIGHPVLEQNFFVYSKGLREEMGIKTDAKIISVTPGSRLGEIKRHMPIIRKTLDKISEVHEIDVIFIQNNEDYIGLISKYLSGAGFSYRFSTNRLKGYAVCDVALSKSGTNNLEIAASRTAQVIGYKMNTLTYILIKMMIKIKYACLINIIAKKEIIPEYIQGDFTDENLVNAISDLLNDRKKAEYQISESLKILNDMGITLNPKPSWIAANQIIKIANIN